MTFYLNDQNRDHIIIYIIDDTVMCRDVTGVSNTHNSAKYLSISSCVFKVMHFPSRYS